MTPGEGPVSRILVAEDNPVNEKVALAMLRTLGYEADVAVNGSEAIDAVAGDHNYSAVLMDCQMPVMDGYEATREIRRREHQTVSSRIPIIALTAAAMEGERERCLAAGMDDYISKPVDLEELEAVLSKWVGSAELKAKPARGATAGRSQDPIEPARIKELRALSNAGNRDPFLILSEIFLVDGNGRLAGIQQSIREGDSEGLARESHALRGSAANLGAMNLAERCAELERLASSGILVEGEDALRELEAEFTRVEEFLKRHVEP